MVKKYFIGFGILLLLVVCSAFGYTKDAFFQKQSFLCDSLGANNLEACLQLKEIKKFGCNEIAKVSSSFGALRPSYPMAECRIYGHNKSVKAIKLEGCKRLAKIQYLIKKDGKIVRLDTSEKIIKVFAPIKNGQEALSFLLLLNTDYPIYSFPKKKDGKYLVTDLVPTKIIKEKNGWIITLFNEPRCGCFVPEIEELKYLVKPDGEYYTESQRIIWRANADMGMCVD